MSWWKKSKYKQSNYNWWEEEEEKETGITTRDNYYGGYGWGGYGSYWKPRYDMSISLETRVTQLIKAITGKSLKLAQAEGWGNDDKYFYYNPEDLRNVSDDEVLGRILQQLGKELYWDKQALNDAKANDWAYRHLWDSLEANRADRQLAGRYPGATYYAGELWEARKFKDNPMAQYSPAPSANMTLREWVDAKPDSLNCQGYHHAVSKKDARTIAAYQQAFEEDKANGFARLQHGNSVVQNDAWEFCFNIHAMQNGEKQFDFTKDEIAGDFAKALPYIDQYLNCRTFEEATKIYPDIKKYYPKPDELQQEQMDSGMGQTQGMSQEEMQEMAQRLAKAEAMKRSGGEVDGQEYFFGSKGDLSHEDFEVQRELNVYKQLKAQHAGTISTLAALLRSIIKDNAIKRFARPFKRGKLDAKRMYKYLATDNLRIFKKPRVVSNKEYTMAIMVDQSGSMNGHLSEHALRGAIVMAEVFEQLGLPYEVLGFRDEVFVYKGFSQPLRPALIPSIGKSGGGTNDLNAIQILEDHIKKFDSSHKYRKGIFVITDGEGADPAMMKEKVTEIETMHNTTVFGIGIGSVRESSLKQTYNTYLKVDNVQALPSTLVSIMKTQFKRG